jgi:subtilisin family serine protease
MKDSKILALVFGLILIVVSIGHAQSGPGHGHYKPEELIVKLLPGYSIDSLNAKYGTFTKGHQIETDVYLLRVPVGKDVEQLAADISAEPGVAYCTPNYYMSAPEGLQRSSPFLDQQVKGDVESQPAATTLQLPAAQDYTTGTEVTVAVIDGGVDFEHPWLVAQPGEIVSGWDYIDNDSLAYDELGGSCTGHGTFVASIIRLTAPEAMIRVYRVLDTAGQGDGFNISSAVLKAIADSCRIINLSLGMTGVHDGLDDALKLARQQNVLVVASAGNDSTDESAIFPFPADREYCLAVAALDSETHKADFSNYGLKVDLCAPGTWIYAPYPDSMYAWWDGTSFSAPFVSGVAALAKSLGDSLSMITIDTLIRQMATNIDSLNPVYSGLLGSGLLDPVRLLNLISPVKRGDWTANQVIDILDLSYMVAYLTGTGMPTSPVGRGDLNCDNLVDLSDLSRLVAFLSGVNAPICPNP